MFSSLYSTTSLFFWTYFGPLLILDLFLSFFLSVKWGREMYSDPSMHSAVKMLGSCVVISIVTCELHVPLMLLF